MQDGPITDGVLRLKELLFEPESQALAALRERIDTLSETDKRIHQDMIERLQKLAEAQEDRRAELARRLAEAGAQDRNDRQALELRLSELAARADREQLEGLRRLEPLFERVGTMERFKASVAASLDSALREAEVDRHKELSEAIAPLVVRTIKTEIRSSHDELADALYPHMGRMVKSYVASAMKDLAEQINRRLEQNPLMLRLRSLTTGRPISELAMAEGMKLEVEELYLIRRGTGELIGRWPDAAGAGNRDNVLSGTLAAVNEFAADAFAGPGSDLRRVDLGNAQIYLRASPLYLLAAKCSGSAQAAVEQVIDGAFLEFIEQHRDRLVADADAVGARGSETAPHLTELAGTMRQKVAERQAELTAPSLGFAPLKWAAVLILAPLMAWFGWSWYLDWATWTTRQAALTALATTDDLKGYPTRLEVMRGGRALTVSGLTPSESAKTAALDRLAARLPGVRVTEQLAVLPNSGIEAQGEIAVLKRNVASLETSVSTVGREVGKVQTEVQTVGSGVREVASTTVSVRRDLASVEAELSRAAERRTLIRAATRLDQALPDLRRLQAELSQATDRDVVQRSVARMGELHAEIRARLTVLDGKPGDTGQERMAPSMTPWRQALASSADDLAGLIGQRRRGGAATVETSGTATGTAEAAEDVAAGIERLAAIVAAVDQANALRLSLPPPPAPPAPQIVRSEPTSRERLIAFVRDHAVFFMNGSDYRDAAQANETLTHLADVLRQTDLLLRVVGYTDERGGQQRNTSVSQARADKVLEALVQLGVPRDRLVAVGRLNNIDLSPSAGAGSPNRRVEFEIGFVGEAPRPERAQ